jgi:two-component system nitrate/nitrite sensor histidine kinase NarX
MLLVAALAITVLFYDLNRANRADIEQFQIDNLANTAHDLARGLDSLVENELSRVRNLALSRSVQEFAAVRPDQRSALFTPTLADFSNFIASNPFYHAVLLLDRDGEVLIATDGSYVGLQFTGSPFFQQALRGTAYMSDPGISQVDRRPVIWLAAPVYTQNETLETTLAPVGVVTVALAPEELWEQVEQLTIGTGGYTMLVDQYGVRLAHGRDRRFIFRSLAPLGPDTWAQLQAEGRFGALPAISDTGNQALLDYLRTDPLPPLLVASPGPDAGRVYYSAATMRTRDWAVVAMLSEAEVLAPAQNATLRGLMATLLVVLLLGFTVTWTAQRIVRPVPRLAQAAAKIAQGDLSTPVSVQGSSEVRALAENFETMRQRLEQSRDELAAWARTLEHRVAQRSHELAALSEVVAFAARSQSRDELLSTALGQALQVMGAEIGGIWIADAEGGLQLAASAGFSSEMQAPMAYFAPAEGVLGQAFTRGEPMALDDISQSPQLARAIVRNQGLHAFAAAPLRFQGRSLGVMGIFSRSHHGFTPEAIGLATSIAQQIALTLDNMQLVEQVQAQARAVAALQERERIAGEIHDGVAQNLGYLYLQADQLLSDTPDEHPRGLRAQLQHMQSVLAATSADIRRFIARLRSAEAPPAPLEGGLRAEVERLAGELALRVDLHTDGVEDLVAPAGVATELARIVAEALRNAANHGGANSASIELQRQNGIATLRISDDGAGFDPDAPLHDGRSHFGISVMRARAARIGGELLIDSRPGAGTAVEVRWAVKREGPGAGFARP